MKFILSKFSLLVRLTLFIGGGAAFILLFISFINYNALHTTALEKSIEKNKILARWISENIENQLESAESTVQLTALHSAMHLSQNEQSYALVEEFIHNAMDVNPMICGMCFVPVKGYINPAYEKSFYAYRDTQRNFVATPWIDPKEDYQQDWYVLPYYLEKPTWCEPYFDQDCGHPMITYSYPLRDTESKIYAILTCDISTDDLWALVNKPELYGRANVAILSADGVFISHKDPNFIMRETLGSLAQSSKDPRDKATFDRMFKQIQGLTACGQTDYFSYKNDTKTWCLFHHIEALSGTVVVYFTHAQLNEEIQELFNRNTLISVLGVMLMLMFALWISRTIAPPLMKLADTAHILATGNFNVEIPEVNGSIEIESLHDAFVKLRDDLNRYIKELTTATVAKEKISSELAIARDIQMGIVPKIFPAFPDHPQVDLYAKLQPALEVGGDLYDFLMLDDDHIYIAIGDVSGKGVPASLLMAVDKTLLKSAIMSYRDPARAVTISNHEIAEHNDACMFITLFCGILNIRTGDFTYTNAGHNPPMIYRDDSGKVELLSTCHGPAVGIVEDHVYQSNTVKLFAKDTLLLYTDGITEAMDPDMKIYSEKRLVKWFESHAGSLNSTELILKLYEEINYYAHGVAQWDDMTTLAIRGCSDKESHEAALTYQELHVANNLSELQEIMAWTESFAQKYGIPNMALTKLHLLIEEWFVNIVSHAYDDHQLHFIDIRIWRDENRVYLRFIDDGIPFDPTTFHPIDKDLAIEKRDIEGLGIYFIQKTVSELIYIRDHNKNSVTMIYPIVASEPAPHTAKVTSKNLEEITSPIHMSNDYLVVEMPQQLDITSANRIQKQIYLLLDNGNRKIVCDFAKTHYISSAGLRVMLLVSKRLRFMEGEFILIGMSKEVKDPFNLAQFTTFMDIRDAL